MAGLLLIDIQSDFCPGGALAVAEGDQTVATANALRSSIAWAGVFLSQDWHPAGHVSFASTHGVAPFSAPISITTPAGTTTEQEMWTDHCIQGTPGAEFCAELVRAEGDIVVPKGTHAGVDSYSAFGDKFGGQFERTILEAQLRGKGVTHVAVVGLAQDFCVKFTCMDAHRLGFVTYLVKDACRAVSPQACAGEMAQLAALGVHVVDSLKDLPAEHFPRRA